MPTIRPVMHDASVAPTSALNETLIRSSFLSGAIAVMPDINIPTDLSSVGILISGITAMAPERKDDLISVSFKALVGATLASCMTGLIVGIFI